MTTPKPSDEQLRWLRSADENGTLSWLMGSKVVSGKLVRACMKNGWVRNKTPSVAEITDEGRAVAGHARA
jgi:SH3-like domain-containing protein